MDGGTPVSHGCSGIVEGTEGAKGSKMIYVLYRETLTSETYTPVRSPKIDNHHSTKSLRDKILSTSKRWVTKKHIRE